MVPEAFFSAEGKYQLSVALHLIKNKYLALIFYYNGIVMYAKYKVEVNIGIDEQDKNSPMNKGKSSDDNWEEGEGEWTLCKPLSKDTSFYKIIF